MVKSNWLIPVGFFILTGIYLLTPLYIRFFISESQYSAKEGSFFFRNKKEETYREKRQKIRIVRAQESAEEPEKATKKFPIYQYDPSYLDNLDIHAVGSSDDFYFSREKFFEYQRIEDLREVEDIPQDRGFGVDYGNVKLRVYGNANIKASYGDSFYVSDKDRQSDTKRANSDAINRGFDLNMDMKISIKGKIGKKITIDVDYDKHDNTTENTFQVQYKALRRKEFVQEVTVGNIDLQFPRSEFAVFEKKSKKTLGMESKMQRGKLRFHTIATLTQGQTALDSFEGSTRESSYRVSEYKFENRKYYQLEPYVYFNDGCNPTITSSSYDRSNASSLTVFTSYASEPMTFVPTVVNITSGSLEVWLDDRNPQNDTMYGAVSFAPNGKDLGNYHRLREGMDYYFFPTSGRLVFSKYIQDSYRIYVYYERAGGSCDPAAISSGSGYIVFIKWDSSLHEDTNYDGLLDVTVIDDGKTNLDVYEFRGVYSMDATEIQENGFNFSLMNLNNETISNKNDLGIYSIDYSSGLISFSLREPFKQLKNGSEFLLNDTAINSIYTERQPSYVGENSGVDMRFDFKQDVRDLKLSHGNILKNSVIVKVNGIVIDPSLYFIDYSTGYFSFNSSDNPIIGPGTSIEVSYEYSPFGTSNQGYILGVRTDYDANRSIQLGSTVLYNGEFEKSSAPFIGSEPSSKMILEGDVTMKFSPEKLTRMVNNVPGLETEMLPFRFQGYGEYAKSFYNPNTFGYALIDDMESSEESISVEISDKDWILGSTPSSISGTTTCSRVPLYYHYYRDPNDLSRGLLSFTSGASDSPDYSQLSGPYNVAEGHLDSSQVNSGNAEKQVSLVLDFDFSKTSTSDKKYVSIVTRNFSSTGMDFSGIQYLEYDVYLRNAVSLSGGVRVYFDLGTVNEDSDADGVFDSEDTGFDKELCDQDGDGSSESICDEGEKNYKIDVVRSTGFSEDRGYSFNPPGCSGLNTVVGAGPDVSGVWATKGNAVLDTEDLDYDGKMNTDESVLTIGDDSSSYLYYDKGSNLITSGGWYHVRVYLVHSAMSEAQKSALSSVKSIRLIIVPEAGSENGSGKIMFDSIKFSGSKWRSVKVRETSTSLFTENDNPRIFRVAMIDNFVSKEEYKDDSYLEQERSTYEMLHGKKTNSEYSRIREAALKLEYTMDYSGTTYDKALARRIFLRKMNLSYYKNINLWVNYKNLTSAGQYLIFRLGSSEEDYYEYRTLIDRTGWQKLKFEIKSPSNYLGKINLKQISMMALGIQTDLPSPTTGTVWINDIYVSDPQVLSDDAYKYEAMVEMIRPMFKTKSGVPILSGLQTTYRHRHKGQRFATIGQTENYTEEDKKEWIVSSDILPFWHGDYRLLRETTDSDPQENIDLLSLRGTTENVSHSTTHKFQFRNPYAPVITTSYTHEDYKNVQSEVSENSFGNEEENKTEIYEKTRAPAITLSETLPPLGKSKIFYSVKTSTSFYQKKEIYAEYEEMLLTNYEVKKEKEQNDLTEASIRYTLGNFEITPGYNYKQILLLEKNYTDTVNQTQVSGDFYFPWLKKPSDFRYRQRSTEYDLNVSYKDLFILSPNIQFSAKYQENSFQDNILTYDQEKMQRLKNPSTIATTHFSTPFLINKIKKNKIIRSLQYSFEREIIFNETMLPFTEKTSVYDDQYGLKRTLPPLMDHAYNLFRYPFWYYYNSKDEVKRNNFSKARDYVRKTKLSLDREIGYDEAYQNYSNNITLRENMSFNSTWNFYDPLILRINYRLGQNVQRPNTDSLPIQTANWGLSFLQNYNLMKMLDFWFFRKKGNHTSTLDLNYHFDRSMRITENIREDRHNPLTTLTFGWFHFGKYSSLSFSYGYLLRYYTREYYINPGDPADDLEILEDITGSDQIDQNDISHEASIEYRTEWIFLKNSLQRLTGLVLRYNPKYTIRLSAAFNRYEYDLTELLTQDAKDQYILFQNIDMNLHANVTGGFDFKVVYDIYRNANNNESAQEIISFEFAIYAKILF